MLWKRGGFRFCYLFCSWLLADSSVFSDFGYVFSFHGVCRGSPFFSLGFFGEAKKSKSPAGASPGIFARRNLLQMKRNLRNK